MEHHKVAVYKEGTDYVVPTKQPQYRMVQTAFETYEKYRDSVYYDASAWSLANFYQLNYRGVSKSPSSLQPVSSSDLLVNTEVDDSAYAYIVDALDYNVPAFTYALQKQGVVPMAAFKPFEVNTVKGKVSFGYGSLVIPVSLQKLSKEALAKIIKSEASRLNLKVHSATTGWSTSGIDLGSRSMRPLKQPKAAMVIGTGTRSYEAGEIWHLLDTRIDMPITKLPVRNLSRVSLDPYNVLVLVSGNYPESFQKRLKDWVSRGNTLITIGTGSSWAINSQLVNETTLEKVKDSTTQLPYVEASEHRGRESLGGVFIKAKIDRTHPVAFGYSSDELAFYKNNTVWLSPSENAYSTVAKYTEDAHIDGYISKKNRNEYLSKAASILVSSVGSGRVVMFADNPNFRGTTYGMNRFFLNALFLGEHINTP